METFSAIGQLGGGDMDVGLAHSTVLRRLWREVNNTRQHWQHQTL